MDEIKTLEKKLMSIEKALESYVSGSEEMLYKFEENIILEIDMTHDPRYLVALKKIHKKIQCIKNEYDFYDEDTILDYMFPNGQDED